MPERQAHSDEYVSLKEYFERLIHEQDRRYEDRFRAVALALDKAEKLLVEYKIGANEWRQTVQAQKEEFVTRAESEARQREERAIIESLRDSINRSEGGDTAKEKSSQWVMQIVALVVSNLLALGAFIVSVFIYSTMKH